MILSKSVFVGYTQFQLSCFHEVGYVATSVHDDMIYVYMVLGVQIDKTAVLNSQKVNSNVHVHISM